MVYYLYQQTFTFYPNNFFFLHGPSIGKREYMIMEQCDLPLHNFPPVHTGSHNLMANKCIIFGPLHIFFQTGSHRFAKSFSLDYKMNIIYFHRFTLIGKLIETGKIIFSNLFFASLAGNVKKSYLQQGYQPQPHVGHYQAPIASLIFRSICGHRRL